MLKAVIEYQDVAIEFFHGGLSQGDTIRTLQVRDIGQIVFEYHCLVVSSGLRTVAPAQNHDLFPPLAEMPGNVFDAGSFPGPTQCQISHADDWDLRGCYFQNVTIQQPIARPHGHSIGNACPPQAASQQCRAEPAGFAGDDAVKPRRSIVHVITPLEIQEYRR